ncbi:MAG TPA: DUF6232 family protein [Roseomonas sp.]|jgi:hypothetical protein
MKSRRGVKVSLSDALLRVGSVSCPLASISTVTITRDPRQEKIVNFGGSAAAISLAILFWSSFHAGWAWIGFLLGLLLLATALRPSRLLRIATHGQDVLTLRSRNMQGLLDVKAAIEQAIERRG